ncbi:hypothetical protein SCHPADRAFT_623851 [Schizopora paradoxa]|uniref:Family A G protein-coupled receptor-like protein n=1 Tax=Schizopora paradoxa TaxID=27342 RepID=A0A0H2R9G8_9AGAM|nr:hypothetical protein SCHPADRAFT_623851 [Schizopora paradoxa]
MSTSTPQGFNSLEAIRPALRDLLLSHSFTVTFVILLSALFYFSTPSTRKRPVFILNVVTLVLALAVGTILDYRSVTAILSPQRHIPISFNIAVGTLGVVQYILIDTTLLLRLLSVYPLSFVGRKRFILVAITPVILKVLRVVNLIIFIVMLARAAQSNDSTTNVEKIWTHSPYLKIEWIAQSVDNAYASSLFLFSLSRRRNSRHDSGEVSFGRATFAQRLRVIFWFAVYSFVFPLLFSIAQLVIIFRLSVDLSTMNQIILVNTSVAVIGVVYATVWVESEAWIEERCMRNSKLSGETTLPVFVLGQPRPSTTLGGSDTENPRHSTMSSGQQSTFLSLGSVSRNTFMPSRG